MCTGQLGINTGSRYLWAAFGCKKGLDEHTFMLDSHESRKSLFGKNPIKNKHFIGKIITFLFFSDSLIFFKLRRTPGMELALYLEIF